MTEEASAGSMLAALTLVAGAMALSFSLWSPVPSSPRMLDLWFGLGLTALGGILLVLRRRVQQSAVLQNLFLVVAWSSVVLLSSARTIEASAIVWGVPLVLASVYAAYYLPFWPSVAQVAGLVIAFGAVSVAVEPNIALLFTLVIVASSIGAAVAVGVLRRARDHYLAELAAAASTDALTGVLNRRGLEDRAQTLRATAARANRPTTLVVIDLDYFKSYNDSHGHAAGDRLLQRMAREWAECLREGDLLARTGGDEFVLVLPNADVAASEKLLGRMRARTGCHWSAGSALWEPEQDVWASLAVADVALYEAKRVR